jgi:hypothetical protein
MTKGRGNRVFKIQLEGRKGNKIRVERELESSTRNGGVLTFQFVFGAVSYPDMGSRIDRIPNTIIFLRLRTRPIKIEVLYEAISNAGKEYCLIEITDSGQPLIQLPGK